MSREHDEKEHTWEEIAPHVDKAVEELPVELRAPIVLHYFSGRTQEQVAEELGVNQSTVSRRLEKGVSELRERLKKAGVVASAAVLTTTLAGNAACAAPAALMAALGKMAIAGVGGAAGAAGVAVATSAASSGISPTVAAVAVGSLKAKAVALIVAGVVAVGGLGALNEAVKRQEKKPVNQEGRQMSETKERTSGDDRPVKTAVQRPPYGFRYEPMQFVENDASLQGAIVRAFVFKQPKDDDEKIIQDRIDEILSEQRDDGSFGDTAKETGGRLVELLELGLSSDKSEVKRAVDAILRQTREGKAGEEAFELDGRLPINAIRALCLAGATKPPEVSASLQWLVDNPDEWIGKGCPWTPGGVLKALWDGRNVIKTDEAIDKGMSWIYENVNDAGCLFYWDPWHLLDCVGYVDHPLCRRIAEKQAALILRAQDSTGGWDRPNLSPARKSSSNVFRALVKYDMLDKLMELPSLPPDWNVVRTISAPKGNLSRMTWDGEKLWVYDNAANEAVAVSTDDGKEIMRVKLPEGTGRGIGWWDGLLAITQGHPSRDEPKRLFLIDPKNGEINREVPLDDLEHVGGVAFVDGKLWLVDSFYGWVSILDPARPEARTKPKEVLPGPLPVWLASAGDAVWHYDFWAPAIMKSDLNGRLLDWGEKPFNGSVDGLAWDGKNLWALDNNQKRICLIEKSQENRTRVKVKRKDNKVWIEGVPTLGWGKRKETTFCGALEATMAVTEHPYTYQELMGYSGLAFRVRWFQGSIGQRWCPSSPVGEFPEEYAAIQKATGWNLPTKEFLSEENPRMERFIPDIVKSINSGMPVLAYEPKLNMDVIYGYEDDGKTLLMRDYFKGEEPLRLPATELGALITFIKGHTEGLTRREAIIEGLRIAVKNWRREPMPSAKGKYWYGEDAYAKWIEDLGKVGDLDDKECENLFFVSWWNFDCVEDARFAAVAFLREAAKLLGSEAGEALERAADLYEKESRLFGEVIAKKEAFLGPGTGNTIEDWSAEAQKREQGILAEAVKIEQAAIAEIEKALASVTEDD